MKVSKGCEGPPREAGKAIDFESCACARGVHHRRGERPEEAGSAKRTTAGLVGLAARPVPRQNHAFVLQSYRTRPPDFGMFVRR